jgi:flagellar basal-body rod protein FlgC
MQDTSPFRKAYEPGHPDADADGYVKYPNIDMAVEQVNALEASRAYEANITAMEVTKAMLNASLRIIA